MPTENVTPGKRTEHEEVMSHEDNQGEKEHKEEGTAVQRP